MIIVLALATAALYGCGTYLLLQRRLTRILLGLALMAHGSVLALLVAGGRTGGPALTDGTDPGPFSDPLVQALALTAIVITFAVTVFLLALANRSWELTGDDTVEDDEEDRRIAARLSTEGVEGRFDMAEDEREFRDEPAAPNHDEPEEHP
jgi:multicomponent Na+:H+ antiporter subunit C